MFKYIISRQPTSDNIIVYVERFELTYFIYFVEGFDMKIAVIDHLELAYDIIYITLLLLYLLIDLCITI